MKYLSEPSKQPRKSYWIHDTTVDEHDRLVLSKKMLRSKPFIALTGAAKQILVELYMRLTLDSYKSSRARHSSDKRYLAKNNGKLVLSYASIHSQFGYSTATISNAINQLVNYGFIEIAELGCGVKRQSHKIALIRNWQDYGKDEFFVGEGKADKPVNDGFKSNSPDLKKKTTSETKEGTTSKTKGVQGAEITQINATTSETKTVERVYDFRN
jgi:hypothetical protein